MNYSLPVCSLAIPLTLLSTILGLSIFSSTPYLSINLPLLLLLVLLYNPTSTIVVHATDYFACMGFCITTLHHPNAHRILAEESIAHYTNPTLLDRISLSLIQLNAPLVHYNINTIRRTTRCYTTSASSLTFYFLFFFPRIHYLNKLYDMG